MVTRITPFRVHATGVSQVFKLSQDEAQCFVEIVCGRPYRTLAG